MRSIFLADEAETRALGAQVAGLLRPGDVIALHGGLGAGKTTLARGLLQSLCGADMDVPSPTYTLVQTYETPAGPLWHYDLYRIETPGDLDELGWDETEAGIMLVEWPERAGHRLPAWRLDLRLTAEGTGRRAALEPLGEDWQTRLNDDGF